MLDLDTTDFRFATPKIAQYKLEARTTELFDEWESHVHSSLTLPDYSLFLQLEEGSIKGTGKIAAALGALYFAIGTYGAFVSGVRTINEQLGDAGNFLAERAPQAFGCNASDAKVRRRGGALSAINRLFSRVQRGELSADDAMLQAERILGGEALTSPGFMEELARSLRDCPRFHEQASLPLEELSESELLPKGEFPRPDRAPRQTPVIGPPSHLRVEVWRESKNERKKSRVIRL
jgi:hypothetical protein